MTASAQTLYDKLWASHVVSEAEDGSSLIYIDRQMLHEVSSPQGFAGLRARKMAVRRSETQMAVADHAVPTTHRDRPIADPLARDQVALLEHNTSANQLRYIPLSDSRHGIVHIIGPEQGFTLPGITLVCGDSHTSTHGAFGALAFGIGASEIECVLATLYRQRLGCSACSQHCKEGECPLPPGERTRRTNSVDWTESQAGPNGGATTGYCDRIVVANTGHDPVALTRKPLDDILSNRPCFFATYLCQSRSNRQSGREPRRDAVGLLQAATLADNSASTPFARPACSPLSWPKSPPNAASEPSRCSGCSYSPS